MADTSRILVKFRLSVTLHTRANISIFRNGFCCRFFVYKWKL